MTMPDISLAKLHMTLPSEAVPRGADMYGWSQTSAVVFGANPVDANTPTWWTGNRYPVWPNLTAWFTIYRVAGTRPIWNSRVEIKNLQVWIKSKSTGNWTLFDEVMKPLGAEYPESFVGASKARNVRDELSGGISVRPSVDFNSHGWGNTKEINVSDLGSILIQMDSRVILDDPNNGDTRLNRDNYVINVGADWRPPIGQDQKQALDAFDGRYIKVLPDWRTSYVIA